MSITRISTQALRILDENRHVEFHSVFARAVTLRAGQRLVTCSADVISAPHGVEMTSGSLAQLQGLHRRLPAEVLDWHPRERRMSARTATTVIRSTPRTTVFDPTLPAVRRDPMSRPVGHLIGHLARVRALTGFGEQWLALTADPRLRAAVETLIDDRVDAGNADDAVLYLLGRGPGLTPSGDDVLVGMIAALWFVGEIDSSGLASLRQLLVDTGTRLTTDISVEYLHYACRGMVAGPLHDLLLALDRSDRTATADAVNQLRRYGHTSGMDCLLGAVTGLRHIATIHRPAPHPRPGTSQTRRDESTTRLWRAPGVPAVT
jgi:uncharacterized protein DUF2877